MAQVRAAQLKMLQIQAENEKQQASMSSKMSQDAADLTRRLYEAEQKHVMLSKQLSDTDAKCRWLQDKVSLLGVRVTAWMWARVHICMYSLWRYRRQVPLAAG